MEEDFRDPELCTGSAAQRTLVHGERFGEQT